MAKQNLLDFKGCGREARSTELILTERTLDPVFPEKGASSKTGGLEGRWKMLTEGHPNANTRMRCCTGTRRLNKLDRYNADLVLERGMLLYLKEEVVKGHSRYFEPPDRVDRVFEN